MKIALSVLLAGLLVSGPTLAGNGDNQLQLDRECERAREEAMVPMREEAIAQCIGQGKKSEAECREYYKDYQGPPNRPALFYNLPECEEAYRARKAAGK